jgi:hypothetical protein
MIEMSFFKKIKSFFVKEILEIRVIDLRKGRIVNAKDLENLDLKGNVLDENKRKISKSGITPLLSFPESWINLIDKEEDYVNMKLVQLENGKIVIMVGKNK